MTRNNLQTLVDNPLRFERRTHDRWEIPGSATIFRLGGQSFGRMHRLYALDYGPGGLGARVDEPIEPGSLVTVGFESSAYTAKRGVVARCMPCGDGYRVAVRFENRLAA
jgi:hypothetical protein